MVVNSFYLIEFGEAAPDRNRRNRLFGLPYGVDTEEWPRRDGRPLHHLCTLETVKLDMPWEEVEALSIFIDSDSSADFEENSLTEALEVYWLEAKALEQGAASDYPDDYEPWWYEDYPEAAAYQSGRNIHLRPLDMVSEEVVREMLTKERAPKDLPERLIELSGIHSFVGGFPIWVQADETPRSENDELMSFILSLNGFHPLLELSPVAMGVLYLFSDQVGQAAWVAQS